MNPIDTATQMWGAVEVAWERDVVNGDARSRASFFSYTVVSVVGLKGVDKLDKAGKVGHATSKADTTLPYNAMKTDKLKETVKANVYATVQQKNQQATNFWKSNFSKEAINKTIEAAKNSAVMTKAKNTLASTNMKAALAKTYQDVVKTPIAKMQAAWEKKKEQLLDIPLPNFGLSPVPLGSTANMTVREGIEATQNTVMQIVGDKDGGGERNKDRENTKFRYKNNPMDNPKVAKEVEENSDAVYGYSPRKESSLNKFGVDWTNQEQVASARAKRMEYLKGMEQKKVKLESEVAKLQNEGMSIEEIARKMSEKRNLDRMQSYIDSSNSEGLVAMKERNIQQYGREEGPTPEQLFEKYGSWEEVIYGSVRTSPAMDVLTGLYKK